MFPTWVNFQACSPVEADSGKMPKTSFSAAFPPRSDHLNTTLHLNSVLLTPSLPNILRNTSTKQKPAISAAFNMSNLNLACTKSEKLDAHDAKIIWLCLFEESGGAAQWEALQACSTAHSSQLTAHSSQRPLSHCCCKPEPTPGMPLPRSFPDELDTDQK